MCLAHTVPMEQGNHDACSVEVITCPEHLAGQTNATDCQRGAEENEVEEAFVPLELPEKFDELLELWADSDNRSYGICFFVLPDDCRS